MNIHEDKIKTVKFGRCIVHVGLKNLILLHAKNKGTHKHMQPHNLISTFVSHSLSGKYGSQTGKGPDKQIFSA